MSDIESKDEDKEKKIYSIEVDGKTYTFGGPCPPIQPMFFPYQKVKEKGDGDDSTQST